MSMIMQKDAALHRPMMTPEQAAAQVGASLSTIWRSGLPKYKVGRLVRFHPDDVAEFARSRGRAA
jgi:excisionase family DNA binding protein